MTTETSCKEDGCPNKAAKGLRVCWAHYQRRRRGAKIKGDVRKYGTGQVYLNSPTLAEAVWKKVTDRARVNLAPSGEPSLYVAQRDIVDAWLKRLGEGQPWLCGERAFKSPVPPGDTPYVRKGLIPASKDEKQILMSFAKANKLSFNALMVTIFDDWFYYWETHTRSSLPAARPF